MRLKLDVGKSTHTYHSALLSYLIISVPRSKPGLGLAVAAEKNSSARISLPDKYWHSRVLCRGEARAVDREVGGGAVLVYFYLLLIPEIGVFWGIS